MGSTSILRTRPPVCQSKNEMPPWPVTPSSVPPVSPSAWNPTSRPPAFSVKFLYSLTLVADSRMAKSLLFSLDAQTKSSADPNALLRHARLV